MPSKLLAPVFLLYAGAAYYALWVIGEQNNVAPGAIALCTSGAVRAVYTGFPEVDKVVSGDPQASVNEWQRLITLQLGLLVAFFESASSLPQAAPFQTAFASIYAIPLVIIQLEAANRSNSVLVRFSLLTGAAAQLIGAGVVVPTWMALYSLVATPGAVTGPNTKIRTIAPAFMASFFGLALLMTNEGRYLSKDSQFIGSAFWQAFPLWTTVLQIVLPLFLAKSGTTANVEARKTQTFFVILTTAVWWKALYGVHELANSTGSTYLDVLWSIVNIPLHPKSHAEACHLFLLFDAAAVIVATFTFVVFSSGAKAVSTTKLGLGILALSPVIGPGAALMAGWRSRDSGRIAVKGKKRA